MARLNEEVVYFESQGPSGNVFAVGGAVQATLKKFDLELYKEFVGGFSFKNYGSYEEVLEALNEWVHLVDVDGEYWFEE